MQVATDKNPAIKKYKKNTFLPETSIIFCEFPNIYPKQNNEQ
jgi:hypothetical protein